MPHTSTRRGRIGALAAATVFALGLSACSGGATSSTGGEPVSGGTLNAIRANPFEGFEMDKGTLNSTYQLSQAVLEPLIRTGEDGESLAPGLAASWKFNKDNTVLTITLDPKAAFSDGKPVTADDVAFSVDTWKAGANYGATYASIESTKVVDEKTIDLNLAAPDTGLPAFLSWATAGIVPKDFGGRPAKAFWQKPIGAGPFTVSEWSVNGKVVLKKSPHYYRTGKPYLDEVVSTFASDPNSITLQMKGGQLDMADEIFPVSAASLPKTQVKAMPEHLTPLLLMNTKSEGLTDASIRQAIGYAIDYDAIVKSALKGYGVAPKGALPTNSPNWAAPSTPYFRKDLAKAKNLLGSAAPKGLTLSYPNDPSSTLMAQIIQDNLSDIGVLVKLRSADSASNFASMSSGEYDLGIFAYNAISPDVSDPAWYIAATSSMFTGFPTEELVGFLGEYAATADPKEKEKAVTKIQDFLQEGAPFLALAHISALEGQREVIHDAHVTPWGTYYLDTIWKNK